MFDRPLVAYAVRRPPQGALSAWRKAHLEHVADISVNAHPLFFLFFAASIIAFFAAH